jgi:hypothetical protein
MPNALAPTDVVNQLGVSDANPYTTNLLKKAKEEYPFVGLHDPIVTTGTGYGYAETWPVGEGGLYGMFGEDTRPSAIPIDRVGIEVRRPDAFTHHDLAAELLHIDPMAQHVSGKLQEMWTPQQLDVLRREALDYEATLKEGRSEKDAIKNATDSALRGYTVGQWPKEVNDAMGYSKHQMELLDALKEHMTKKR